MAISRLTDTTFHDKHNSNCIIQQRKEGKMKKKLIFELIILALFTSVILAGPTFAAEPVVTWKVYIPFHEGLWHHKTAQIWADDVFKMSGGRMEIESTPGEVTRVTLSLPLRPGQKKRTNRMAAPTLIRVASPRAASKAVAPPPAKPRPSSSAALR